MGIFVFIGHVFEFVLHLLRGVFIVTLLLAVAYVLYVALAVVIELAKRRYRRYQRDARIIRQAKAMGVWNTNAGGRALELYAKEFGVKKFAGESDAHLRLRIKEKAELNGR